MHVLTTGLNLGLWRAVQSKPSEVFNFITHCHSEQEDCCFVVTCGFGYFNYLFDFFFSWYGLLRKVGLC